MRLRFVLFFVVILTCLPMTSFANYATNLNWNTIETQHFLIHYHTGLEPAANEISSMTRQIHEDVTQYFNWVPRKKTHIVLSDQSENPNGSASVFPNNRIELFMAPPSEISGLEDYDDWKRLVLKHEYVHIVHLDKAQDFPLHARDFIGRQWLFFPNTFLPRWLTEGIATFIETEDAYETGRGQSHFYRALMKNEVKHGLKTLNQINQYRTEWPSGTGFYLYGVYFFNFLRDVYGEKQIKRFIEEYSRFPIPYFINTVATKTFGKNMFTLWDEFEFYLQNQFAAELASDKQNRKQAITTPITSTGYFSGFSRIMNNKLYYIETDQEHIKTLLEREIVTNKQRVVMKIPHQDGIFPQSFHMHKDNGILMPLLEIYDNFRQSFDLFQVDPVSGEKERLTESKRYIRAIWSPDGTQILALGNHNGLHQLDLLQSNGQKIKKLWQGKPGFAINAFDWSPTDNKLIMSMYIPGTGWSLVLFDMETSSWKSISDNLSIEAHPQFSNDGSDIIYSADYDGRYNIYRLSLENPKSLKQLTHTNSLALFPTLSEDNNRLFFSELDNNGFNLKSVSYGETEVNNNRLFGAGVDTNVDYEYDDNNIQARYQYSAIHYLAPPWWLPIMVNDSNQSSFGFITNTNDPLQWHNYQAILLYDFQNSELKWNVSYLNVQHRLQFLFNSRKEIFYSTELERDEIESSLAFILPFNKLDRQWQLLASTQYIESTLSVVNTTISARESDFLGTLSISYNSINNNVKSVSPHDGFIATANYKLNKVETTVKQHSRASLDAAYYSPHFYHATIVTRGIIVGAGSNANSSFVGGAISDDLQNNQLGSNNYSLKGYEVNQFSGTNLQKASLQVNYPLFFPETGFMRPPVGLNRINVSGLYEAARVGSFDSINSQNWFSSIAIELNFKSNFGYGRWPLDIKVGVAKGLEEFGETRFYSSINIAN